MSMSMEMRRCLVTLDLDYSRKIWAAVSPQFATASDNFLLASLHIARTQTESIPAPFRLYSHEWLTERNLPSYLPDKLKPKWEQQGGQKVVHAVGISVNSDHQEVIDKVSWAMSVAVLEAYADGNQDPAFVKGRILEAREKELRGLGLRSVR